MTDKEMNKTIADRLGLIECDEWKPLTPFSLEKACDHSNCVPRGKIPDYCNDLNLMHGIETTLNPRQKNMYGNFLFILAGGDIQRQEHDLDEGEQFFICANASARQRAEAFLLICDGVSKEGE